MAATQKNRLLAIKTALAADALLLRSFHLNEQLGRLFHIEAELVSGSPDVDFDALVGTNATVRLATPSGETRFLNGCISRFVLTGNAGSFATYRATLVPWLWFLTRTSDCRIFQNKKVPDIIEDVFKGHGFKDFKLKLSATYREWEYCVQYRETDFNFVSRLMEQEGIYYYFEHADGKHELVLIDAPGSHEEFPGYASVTYRPKTQAQDEHSETVTDWMVEHEVQTGLWALRDFNFKTPASPIEAKDNIDRSHEHAGFEMYDYPGAYATRAEGDAYAKLRIQEVQSQHKIIRGQSTVRGLVAGFKVSLKGHFRADQNGAYLVTGTSLQASTGAYETGAGESRDFFSCGFTAIPAAEIFRAARTTPKPLIQGPQTAIVVGKAGEEIDVDEFGRVKVQFHWDRYGKADENSSCWTRVSHGLAGKNWGAIYTPRIGQEVIVDFLEGDPDRPIITGRVYNATNKVPHPLPANKTMSTLKSNSSKGGQGFNEIRFEDKKGEEQIFIHGEKNQDIRIKNDRFEWIGNNQHLVVKKDQFEHIENNRHEIVDASHKEKIRRDRHLLVGGKEAKEIAQTFSLKVGADVGEEFGANHSEVVTGDYYLKAENIVIEGLTSVTIKVGKNSIAIDKSGITIGCEEPGANLETTSKGDTSMKATMNVNIEATAKTGVKGTAGLKLESTATAELSGAMTTAKAQGVMTVQGAVVKIN